MRSNKVVQLTQPARISRSLNVAALIVCLLAPSAWLMATTPPLWRDLDAYHQLTQTPARSTQSGHGPLYGVLVRVPLFVGYHIERLGTVTDHALVSNNFYRQPELTDTGITLLLAIQHLALAASAVVLIVSVSKRTVTRFALAILFASVPVFYTFAHCVGSEALGTICVLLVAAFGLRVVKSPNPTLTCWYGFALGLYLCMLARHVNGLIAIVLPITFLSFCGLLSRYRLLSQSPARRHRLAFLVSHYFQRAVVATIIGIACIAVARTSTRQVCEAENVECYSRLGSVFLTRLEFLTRLSEEDRTKVLNQVAERTESADATTLLQVLHDMLRSGSEFTQTAISRRGAAELSAAHGKKISRRDLENAFSELARAFVFPPVSSLTGAIWRDLTRAASMPMVQTTDFLFATTSYFFKHAGEMPQCANLATFRQNTAESLENLPRQNAYLALGRLLSPLKLFAGVVAMAISVSALGVTTRRRAAMLHFYCGSLIIAAAAILGVTLSIHQLLPRFTLPLWQLFGVAFIIYAGATIDALARRVGHRWAGGPSHSAQT